MTKIDVKKIRENLSGKYSLKFFDHAKKFDTDGLNK